MASLEKSSINDGNINKTSGLSKEKKIQNDKDSV